MNAHLILGGARSGKSRYAEQLATQAADAFNAPLVYVATATAGDAEMAQRIQRHQDDRGDGWLLVEETIEIVKALDDLPQQSVVLIDCLTLWLSNCLNNGKDDWNNQKAALVRELNKRRHHIIMVSNEIGMGVIPMGELTRHYVDELGWLHQDLAHCCQHVTMVVAGLPQTLK